MRELGWIDGRTVQIEWRYAGGDNERLTAQAVELVAAKVDVRDNIYSAPTLEGMKPVATALGMKLQPALVKGTAEYPAVFSAWARQE
jgi:hypothetical protein